MSKMNVLRILRPILQLLPEVEKPAKNKRISFKDKAIMTGVVLLIYLICCQIPLYGVAINAGGDPFYWMRAILASNRGSLMELGISPIVTSGMIIQLLSALKVIEYNQESEEEQKLYDSLQKLVGLCIALFEGVAYVWGGMYGELEILGYGNACLIVMQLVFASYMTILLDELMNNGFGLGSGINLFIAVNMCETIVWETLSPMTVRTESGQEYEGALVCLLHGLLTKSDKLGAIQQAFYRSSLPNVNNLLATLLVFLIVIYFQGFKVNIPVQNKRIRGGISTYPIKLFYTSNIPIILQSALISNLYFISQLLYKKFRTNFLVRLLGQWQELDYSGQSVPVAGLAYMISPPKHLSSLIYDPIHTLFYICFILGTCALFSRQWIQISG